MSTLQQILVITTLSFCNNSQSQAPETNTGFTCNDYEIMMDVELRLAQSCTENVECTQVLFEGDQSCESNSVLGSEYFDSEYLFDLYDEAIAEGCSIDLPMNTECSNTTPACVQSKCVWVQ